MHYLLGAFLFSVTVPGVVAGQVGEAETREKITVRIIANEPIFCSWCPKERVAVRLTLKSGAVLVVPVVDILDGNSTEATMRMKGFQTSDVRVLVMTLASGTQLLVPLIDIPNQAAFTVP